MQVKIHWKPKSEKYRLSMCDKFDLPTYLSINSMTLCTISDETYQSLKKAVRNGLIGVLILD